MKQLFRPVAECRAGAQDCLEILGTGAIYAPSFVRDTGDLVEVATDGPEFGDCSLERGKLPIGNPCDASQVGPVAVKGFLDTGLWVMNSVRQPTVGSQRNGHGAAERAI
jgi:hypothetical protein